MGKLINFHHTASANHLVKIIKDVSKSKHEIHEDKVMKKMYLQVMTSQDLVCTKRKI